jgi:uncharacterized protein YeaO (DUF488 family)
MIRLKRAFELASKDDGVRVLVERLWPRGVSKKAQIDLWLKSLAPRAELRQWYGHDPARWPRFRKRYRAELKGQGDVLALLRYVSEERAVTFVYAASDEALTYPLLPLPQRRGRFPQQPRLQSEAGGTT